MRTIFSHRKFGFADGLLLLLTLASVAITSIQCRAQSNYEPYTFTSFAGDAGYGSSDGTGRNARFNGPFGVAVDNAGNVYVADTGNHTIRKILLSGVVTTLAGSAGISGSADGIGSAARFNHPQGVAVDSAGTVYVADTHNATIRKVTVAGVVTTMAGHAPSFDPDGNIVDDGQGSIDGTGSAARFNGPASVAVDSIGNVYVADSYSATIRKVTQAGVVTTLAGLPGNLGSTDGTGAAARFGREGFSNISGPSGVAVDSAGNVYVADIGNQSIRKVTPAGVVTTLTGSAARFDGPASATVDGAGNIYVTDALNFTIRKVTPNGVVTTVAGLAGSSGNADGIGSDARFGGVGISIEGPYGIAVDGSGNVFVADSVNNTIRKITPAALVTTLAGGFAGPYGSYGSADGTGSAARFNWPVGVAVDSAGNVYVVDRDNIRKITPEGEVTTLTGAAGISFGEAMDGMGNVYVVGYDTIQKVSPAGVVTTLAGLAGVTGTADGTGSDARFGALLLNGGGDLTNFRPEGIAVDRESNLYVADTGNNTIRKGYPTPRILTSAPGFGFKGSQFGFDITGPTGHSVVVDASNDLLNWLPIWTNAFTSGLSFSDPQSGSSSNRFYRTRTQ